MQVPRTIDITFARADSKAAMYRLWADSGSEYQHNLVAHVPDQPPYASWSIGKDDWKDDHVVGKTDSGRLYHAELSYYPVPGEPTAVPIHAAVKWMRGERAIRALRKEASLYTGPMRGLQGKIVPILYGFYTGTVEGIEIGCLVLEWCPDQEWVTFGKPTEAELFARMDAVKQLHDAGIKHGQLYDRRDSLRLQDGRHFLHAQDGTIRIVGFQQAKVHKCAGGLHERDSLEVCLDDKCRELCYAEVHWRRAFGGGLEKTRWRPY